MANEGSNGVALLTVRDLCRRLAVSRTTIYERLRTGKLPAPIYVGDHCPRWPSDEIDSWIDSLRAEREAAA